MENEGGGGLCSLFCFCFSPPWKKGRRSWPFDCPGFNSAGPCALICIGRSFPAAQTSRPRRCALTSAAAAASNFPFVPFRRQGIDYCGFNIPGPFIGGYGGCYGEQTDIKVIKGRRIRRRKRLIAFLEREGFSSLDISRVRYWKSPLPRTCFIATGNETIGRFNSFVRNGCGEIMAVKTRKPGLTKPGRNLKEWLVEGLLVEGKN